MRKVILVLSGILVSVFVIVMAVNAAAGTQDVKKAATEASKDCGNNHSTACEKKCAESSTQTAACDPAKCKEKGCDPAKCKEAKCDPSKCKDKQEVASGEGKKCGMSAGCCKGSAKN